VLMPLGNVFSDAWGDDRPINSLYVGHVPHLAVGAGVRTYADGIQWLDARASTGSRHGRWFRVVTFVTLSPPDSSLIPIPAGI